MVTYFFPEILIRGIIFIIYLWSDTSDHTDRKNVFKIIHWQYLVTLNMFWILFSFNIIVFFVLYFDHWYVLYMHNCMYAFQIMHIRKNCIINTDRLTFFIINVYYLHETNGNLFIFNCIGILSKLHSNVVSHIVVQDEPWVWFL